MAQLQDTLTAEFGKRNILGRPIPEQLTQALNPQKPLRPYQETCLRYFMTYMEEDFEGRAARPHLLFHMATGSGKTLMMAAAMNYLYERGYRNFLFFVDSNNIVEKTRDNFLNAASQKYLFAPTVTLCGRPVEVREVANFQGADCESLNLCLTTIQGLHADLNSEKENALTFDDLADSPVVLISDEAHHLNAATRRGRAATSDEEHTRDWESTVMRIFHSDNGRLPNVLLEFTATMDLGNPDIARKYEDKIICDYPLREFRRDGYSKEVETVETASDQPLDRALQAVILSQLKRKLFATIHEDIKPVVMLKSKTIAENKTHFEAFKKLMAGLRPADIDAVRTRATGGDLHAAFGYFASHGITDENLVLELQTDFAEERLLLVDGNNISPEKQRQLNSLEEAHNGIRAVFAVDMLNEGWDVLNLFDIVRLYDTRDAKDGKPGKTTMQEAQLIGRGARYMPFADPKDPTKPRAMRKYDGDAANPLRVVEKLHYHCAHNPRYIQELHKALVETGVKEDHRRQLHLFMKDEFKQTELYRRGLVFTNNRLTVAVAEDDGTLGKALMQKTYVVDMPMGAIRSDNLLDGEVHDEPMATPISLTVKAHELGRHVWRAAMNLLAAYSFDSLRMLYPSLRSCAEFATSDSYLANLSIEIRGRGRKLADYSREEWLHIASSVLSQLLPLIASRGKSYKGTKLFAPKAFKEAFRDDLVLEIAVSDDGQREFGLSQLTPRHPEYTLDLRREPWYAYNDNFGTSEEKALVKYVEGMMPRLREKYMDIYLVRNEKDVKIYDFAEGRAFEPDFILFMRHKGTADHFDNLQIFIEPKGEHLIKADKWKEDFLLQLQSVAEITWITANDQYVIWGLPFFNEGDGAKVRFANGFEELLKSATTNSYPRSSSLPYTGFAVER